MGMELKRVVGLVNQYTCNYGTSFVLASHVLGNHGAVRNSHSAARRDQHLEVDMRSLRLVWAMLSSGSLFFIVLGGGRLAGLLS